MSWLSNIIRGKAPKGNMISFSNPELKDSGAAGADLTGEGLGDLRNLGKTYQGYIDNGGLTPDLNRQFDVAGGTLADNYARAGRSLSAALAARRAQSGGALTPQAIAEMEKEGAEKSGEAYFSATNDLAQNKAELSYKATSDWYGRLENIADTIRTTGMTKEQQSLLARLQLAGLQLQKRGQTLGALGDIFKGLLGVATGGKK